MYNSAYWVTQAQFILLKILLQNNFIVLSDYIKAF